MIFSKPKLTVTPEDKEWIEDAFLWFEEQYTPEFLRSLRIVEPTKEFFSIEFKGTEDNAFQLTEIICDLMNIKNADIELHFYSDSQIELDEGIITTQGEDPFKQNYKSALGTYSENGVNQYSIGIEKELLKNPINLIATIAHELSHIKLLGEGKLEENDEELTDLNAIALGFGIFTANSIFRFQQYIGTNFSGWQASRSGYIPEQVAAYALALLTNYRTDKDLSWTSHLNSSMNKMVKRNLKYLEATKDTIKFK